MADAYAVLLTSCADRSSAKALARALVERRLAACVQMLPIESVYEWQGKIEEAAEILLDLQDQAGGLCRRPRRPSSRCTPMRRRRS